MGTSKGNAISNYSDPYFINSWSREQGDGQRAREDVVSILQRRFRCKIPL